MRQFLLGATCGALSVGTLALVIRHDPSTGASASPTVVVEKIESASNMPDLVGTPLQIELRQNQTHTENTKLEEPSSSPSGSIQGVVRPRTTTAKLNENAYSVPSISLSAEHARLLSPEFSEDRVPTIQELHMQFVSERDDQNWSLAMEQNLSQFLAQHNTAGEFEILTLDCRSTLCEILAFGNLPNSPQRWSLIVSDMGKQPWWSNFKGNSTSSSETNGRTTIVTILVRRKS